MADEVHSRNGGKVNVYDKGMIANIADFFDNDLFFFWLPLVKDVDEDGSVIERSPICTPDDLRLFNKKMLHGDNV